jgi:hypothetical protein
MERDQDCVDWQVLVCSGAEPSGSATTLLVELFMWLNTCVIVFILSRVRGLRDNNKRGFSGFNEGVYLNPCRDYTLQILTHNFVIDSTHTRVF